MVLPSEVKKQQQKKLAKRESSCCFNSDAKPSDKSWLRQNWCCALRIFFAVVGIAIPLYIIFLMPCEGNATYEKQPVDLFVILDGSGSLDPTEWALTKDASARWIQEFERQIPQLQVGISQFSDETELHFPFSLNVSAALSTLEGIAQMDLGTNFQPALELFLTHFTEFRTPGSFSVLLFLSDGSPTDDSSALWNLVNDVKNTNTTLVGAMINGPLLAQDLMYRMSSCEGYANRADCPNYVEATDFEEFSRDSQALAESVALQVGSVETKSCEPGLWWLSLLGVVPLLLLLFAGCCVSKKKTKKRVRKAPAGPDNDVEDPANPQKRIPKNKKKKAYKWDIAAADNYLWNFAGGATRMSVDFGNKAPPSAPKDWKKGRIKRGVNTWEEADGWTYEEIEEDQTLEEWAEEKAAGFFSCCCCCCSSQTSTQNEQE